MKALLLCASHNDLGTIRALRKLGYYIIVIGSIPNLCGEKFANRYIQMDYSQKEQVLELAEKEKIDAIVQCCNDFGVYTAAYVAEKMGLKGYDSYETTLLLHNKDKFKIYAQKKGLISLKSVYFPSKQEACTWLKNASFPLIVKPVDCSAGNGIRKIEKIDEGLDAINYAFEKSRAGRIVIEPFITGSQHGFCTFLKNKKVVAYCTNNEYSFLNPYRVEIDTFPADNYERVSKILIEQVEKIAEDLNLVDGIFHLQYIMDKNTPQIIEVMRRILGNMYHIPGNALTGIDFEYFETRARCGLSLDFMPDNVVQEGFYAYKTILANKNGTIRSINIPSEYKPYVTESFFIKKSGDVITHFASEPVGFLFMQFASQECMKKILIEEYRNDLVDMI